MPALVFQPPVTLFKLLQLFFALLRLDGSQLPLTLELALGPGQLLLGRLQLPFVGLQLRLSRLQLLFQLSNLLLTTAQLPLQGRFVPLHACQPLLHLLFSFG